MSGPIFTSTNNMEKGTRQKQFRPPGIAERDLPECPLYLPTPAKNPAEESEDLSAVNRHDESANHPDSYLKLGTYGLRLVKEPSSGRNDAPWLA
jgi:hypothetical protein